MSKSERITALEEQVSDLFAQINAYASSSHARDKELGALIDKHFREMGQRLNAQNELNARWRSENDQRLAKVIETVDDRLTQMQSDINTLRQKVDGPDKCPPSVDPLEGKPSDIEVIAERLAKVEAQLAASADPAWIGSQFNKIDERFGLQMDLRLAQARALNARIDKVAEIIGERVSGLVDRLDKLEKPWEHQPAEVDPFPYPPGFPTGGAHTLEGATEAVLPVPQRGDRVRLEGARSSGGTTLTGWYDVLGRYEPNGVNLGQFQVGNAQSQGMYWVFDADPNIKEVRHADHT